MTALTLLNLVAAALAVAGEATLPTSKGIPMMARGTFDVKLTPQPADGDAAGPVGRLLLDKRFLGDLEGTSKGTMLGVQTAVEGSGAYVALEQFTGTLNGKRGTFMLQHRGTMRAGAYELEVTVVPDSGTEELVGISGSMKIVIEGKQHSYEFEYTLAS